VRAALGAAIAGLLLLAGPVQAGPQPKTFDIVASGDLLIHSPVYERARALGQGRYDFRPMLARVRPIVRGAALAFCHVETPMGAGAPSGYPRFNSPPELAAAIKWAGWDACDTASNHSVDRGQAGIDATARALDAAGVKHTGSFRSAAEARQILVLPVEGIRIAFLAYTYGTNGLPSPHPWSVNLISLPKIAADARRARRLGADLVVANFHWGDEYVHTPNRQQRWFASVLLRNRIVDLVLGQHVHVVQPIHELFGEFAVFGEGNLLSNQTAECCPRESQDGLVVVAHVRVAEGQARVTGVDYVPTFVQHPSFVVQPISGRIATALVPQAPRNPWARDLLDSYRRTVGYAGTGPHVHPVPRLVG
jgi:poly-gamma-glutamate capsule biosynthesis protein CapA/YwtB (metallophosphatase superfamily)